MSNPQDKFDFVPDVNRLSTAEENYVRRVEEDQVLEFREEEVREQAHKRLWTLFQQTASALTQLYRDQGAGRGESAGAGSARGPVVGVAWGPFQSAAGSLTTLYKDSLEEYRVGGEVNRKLGYHRARRELTTWARGKRRFIRRDELLSFLANSSPGIAQVTDTGNTALETDFATGLSLASRGLPGQQLLASMGAAGQQQQGGQQPMGGGQQVPPLLAVQEMFELSRLDVGQGQRYKRPPPSPGQDENMDSPSHKKSRQY